MNFAQDLPTGAAAIIMKSREGQILRAYGYLTKAEIQIEGVAMNPSLRSRRTYLDFRMLVEEGQWQDIANAASQSAPVQKSVDEASDKRLDDSDTPKQLPEQTDE